MAATQKPAQKKQSTGFQGVRNAVWIIAAMFIVAVCIFKFVLGNPDNFVGGDPEGEVLNGNMLGTIYKGGIVVPVLITLMLTVLCLSVERYLAQRTAFGKMATTKFVVAIKAALAKNDFVEAKNLRRWREHRASRRLRKSLRFSRLMRRLYSWKCQLFR